MNSKEYHRQYHQAHIEKWREYNKADYERRREVIRKKRQTPEARKRLSEYLKKWRANNVEKRRQAMKDWLEKNPNHIKEYRAEYKPRRLALYQEQREKICAQKRAASSRYRQRVNRYSKNRRKTDINFALAGSLRAKVSGAVRRQGAKKSSRTMELVGCSIDALRNHLESRFVNGMSWENRHLWEIDHIKPVVLFDLKDAEQQKLAFHWSNTQPLWRTDNRRKSSKWSG